MILIKINDFEFLVKQNISILEACKYAGIHIPRFCYHEMLSVSGNCRMCLVEIENIEKPVASCVTEVDEGMSILLDTPFVKKARENVVEALLLNHPLDCPICDQAGECDLQDQAKAFGGNFSRFFFERKGVEDKYCGPLIKTIMTRCISCTRCVRYGAEIAGVNFFGTLNRGGNTEIGSYTPRFFNSEISGNVIELCPVGALTSKPYAFKARPWELRLSESIDFTDSLGSNIYVNYKETEIYRITPKSNSDINKSIISDKTRFFYDSNNKNRIHSIYKYSNIENKYSKLNWNDFINDYEKLISKCEIEFIIDDKLDLENGTLLKKIENEYSNNIKVSTLGKFSNKNIFINKQFNAINEIEKADDIIVLLGSNPKLESSVLNARIRFKYNNSLTSIYSSGMNFDYNLECQFINLNISNSIKILEGKCLILSKVIYNSSSCLFIVGENFGDNITNINSFINTTQELLKKIKLVYLYQKCNSEGLNYLNFKKLSLKTIKKNKVTFFINLDDVVTIRKYIKIQKNTKKIWLNTHGSFSALSCNYVLPTSTPFESEQTFLNIEHKPQTTNIVFTPLFDSRNIKSILKGLFESIHFDCEQKKKNLSDSYILELVKNPEKYEKIKNLQLIFDQIELKVNENFKYTKVSHYPIFQKLKNFYGTDTMTRNSQILQQCNNEVLNNYTNFVEKTKN
jgi:NADH-quinone oxidoreductase chain G